MALGFLYGSGGGGGQPEPEIKALIPAMTSNTAPSGVCSASSSYNSSYPAWRGFDGDPRDSTPGWNSVTGESNSFLAYAFPSPVVVKSINYVDIANGGGVGIVGIKFQASNDGANWTDLTSEITLDCRSARQSGTVSLVDNKTSYTNYRLYLSTGTNGLCCQELQLYGYYPDYRPLTLYDSGSWTVGYDNPGGYTWSNVTPAGFTLESAKLSKAASTGNAMIGTTNKIDLAKYSTAHVLAKVITFTSGGSNAGGINIDPTDKELGGSGMVRTNFTTLGQTVEYTADVSALGSAYISIFSNSTAAVEIYKIWLT